MQASSAEIDADADKIEEYILEQWNRADVDRDNSVSLEECAMLLRKMNCDLPKKMLKKKMKRAAMDYNEYRDLMIGFMSMRPEVAYIIQNIKAVCNPKPTKSFNSNFSKTSIDVGDLTVKELLYFLNTMQRTPDEPEITIQELRRAYLGRSKDDTVSMIQLVKILDHARNSLVDPVLVSRGCGGKASHIPIISMAPSHCTLSQALAAMST